MYIVKDILGVSDSSIKFVISFSCGILGLMLVLGLYALLATHIYAFVVVICPLIKSRLGSELGLVWIVVGFALFYNIIFNHFWAMVIKPGSP